jgi:uncharacterized protein YndB with AHSA1/START domain
MQRTEKIIEIDAPVERVFDLFSDFESFPRWMRNIKDVRYTGRRYSRWKAEAPLGTSVEWEAETTHFEPDHKIAWRTVRGDVDVEGEVIFEETRRGTTRLRVVLGYDPPTGRLGALVASLFGKNPERQLEEDLERFADVVEGRRESRGIAYDGRGRREMGVPARRERGRAADDYDEGFSGRAAREDFYARDPRRESGRDQGYRSRDDEDDDRHRERESRRRFDEALREARRSQMEGQRRYREERERDEQRRYDEAHRERGRDPRRAQDERRRALAMEDQRRREMDERRNERRMNEEVANRRSEDEPRERPFRHPMTPREWERERERGREPDREYSKQAFRRGVDKLMDEPPSGRWRRWE